MRTAILAPVALLLCLAPAMPVPGVAQDAVYVNQNYGFQIDRPGEWTFSEIANPDGVEFSVKLAKAKNGKETSLTILVAHKNDRMGTSIEARNAIETDWKNNDKLSNITRGKGKLADMEAPFLKATYAAGEPYTIRQHFLVNDDFIYILQSLAPEKEFKDADKALTPLLESFDFVPIDKDLVRLTEIAANCGSEVNFAENWQQAAALAKQENKLVLVVFEIYSGLLSSRFTLTSLFMHPDVVELVNERFVPLFWEHGMNAPFDDPKVFGLGPMTFGNGLMVATSDGRIVAQATTTNPHHVYDICRKAAADHNDSKPANPNDATERMRRGELGAANELLKEPINGLEWRVRAQLLRKLRRGEDALAALKNAASDGESRPNDEAFVHLSLGDATKAAKLTAKAKDAEGKFWNCCARASEENLKSFAEIELALRELALAHPDSRWGWLAASIVIEPRLRGVLRVFEWPSTEQFNAWNLPGYEFKDDALSAGADALTFLIEAQQADGRWVNPRSANGGIFDAATTAICATALLPHRDVSAEPCDKALDYLIKQELVADPSQLFDYTIWAQIFTLDYLARCNELGLGDKRKNSRAMDAIIKDMEKQQYPGGGWGYFHYDTAPDNSIGFVTAPALLSLKRAKAAGAKVPDRMLIKAADALEYLQNPNGSYGYMWMNGKGDPAREAESALRSPLYALTLKRVSRLDADGVTRALDVYMKHREHVIKERGKSICHTGPEGTAPYYLLFGYRFAAEAVNELPKAQREKYIKALTHDVLQFRLSDGSFLDYQSIGREYGAAMALTALDQLKTAQAE